MDRNDAIARLESRVEANKKRLEAFPGKFAENPHYALDWSESVFAAAAENHVFERVLEWLRGDATVNEIRAAAYREMQTAASNPNRSTSAAANLMEDHERAAWADLFDPLGGVFKGEPDLLETLVALTPDEIRRLGERLGPCQASLNLMEVLTTLRELKDGQA